MVMRDIGKEVLDLIDEIRQVVRSGVFVLEPTVDDDGFAETRWC